MLRAFATLTLLGALLPAYAGTDCAVPPDLLISREPNIFSAEREADLGDAMAEQLRASVHPISDPAITAHLQRIGDRITAQVGGTAPYQYDIVDMAITQAFSIAGGHVYVSRKMIGIAETEDELAGVLGHEIGHIATHQAAIRITRELRVLLGVTEVHDRQDVFRRYHELQESYRRDPEKVAKLQQEKDQIVADRVGLYATAAAGYDPDAEPRIFDRITGNNGETGSALSNFFNFTSNESKRLRDLLRTLPKIPASCQASVHSAPAEFTKWKAEVADYHGKSHHDLITGLQSTIELSPPLRSDFHKLRFSPNGQFILALDESGATVLRREPLAIQFRIDLPDIHTAGFDPASENVVLETRAREVEKWSIAEKKRIERHEIFSIKSCSLEALAPDGKTVACLDNNHDLHIEDVASGSEILAAKAFGIVHNLVSVNVNRPASPARSIQANSPVVVNTQPQTQSYLTGQAMVGSVHMTISPDAHYLLAVGAEPLWFDLSTRQKLALPKSAKKLLTGSITFLSPTRLLAVNPAHPLESQILSVPDFEPVGPIELLQSSYEPATDANYLLMRPFRDFAVAVVDLREHKVIKGSKAAAFDIYNDEFLTERVSGEIGIFGLKSGQIKASLTIPAGRIGSLHSFGISDDGKWLAVSNRSRGAIWNLSTGAVALTANSFSSAVFRSDDSLLVDMAKIQNVERHLALLRPAFQSVENGPEIKGELTWLEGSYRLAYRPQSGEQLKVSATGPVDMIVDVADPLTGKLLWSRSFAEGPARVSFVGGSDRAVAEWSAATAFAADQIKNDPALRERWDKINRNSNARLYLILNASTGAVLSSVLVDTGNGSFRTGNIFLVGDTLLIGDSSNRCLSYSLKTGELTGRAFGHPVGWDASLNLVAIENGGGDLRVHSLPALDEVYQAQFGTTIVGVHFTSGAVRTFLAVGSNQKVYQVAMQ